MTRACRPEGMRLEVWYLVMGALLVAIALVSSVLKRLPLTSTMLYLGVGILLGPLGAGVVAIHPLERIDWLERLSELGVIVSLFTAGLKLRVPLRLSEWSVPLRLAFLSMVVTVGLMTAFGAWAFALPLGAAILLAAILAPTDPVLASEVQLENAADRDKLRFSITGEAGLNDGIAFPFVMLGLGLLGAHELGQAGWRWMAVDVAWAILGGLGIGALLGWGIGQLVVYLRRKHKEGFGRDEFLALGLIGAAYGLAVVAKAYGFLAVFAAGLALRAIERRHTGPELPQDVGTMVSAGEAELATHPEKAPALMAEAVLTFNTQLERILEVGLVIIVGTMLSPELLRWRDALFVPVLLLFIRPTAVWIGLAGLSCARRLRVLTGWFGIRGVGSLYYLAYAITHGLPEEHAPQLISVTLWTVAISVVVHGVSVTPLMNWYQAREPKPKPG